MLGRGPGTYPYSRWGFCSIPSDALPRVTDAPTGFGKLLRVSVSRRCKKGSPLRRALEVRTLAASKSSRSPNIVCPRPQRRQGWGAGSAHLTRLLDFRDSYYARSGLLYHLSSDGFDYWSDRLFHPPSSLLHWRGFRLGGSFLAFAALATLRALPRAVAAFLFCAFDCFSMH